MLTVRRVALAHHPRLLAWWQHRDSLLGHYLSNRVRNDLVVLRRKGGMLHLPSMWSFSSPHQTVVGLDPMHHHKTADERPPKLGAARDASRRYLTMPRRLTRQLFINRLIHIGNPFPHHVTHLFSAHRVHDAL